jgi:hypothetical protein
MIMSVTIGETFLFIMTVTMERFLTFSTNKVLKKRKKSQFRTKQDLKEMNYDSYLHMPVLSESCHDSLFNRSTTSSTNRDAHLVMTAKTIQLILKHMDM